MRQYGRQLDRSLVRLVETASFDYAHIQSLVEASRPGDVVLVHYEPGLIHVDLKAFLRMARMKGAKVAFCCHWFGEETLREYTGHVDRFIVHRAYPCLSEKCIQIPLGCPTYDPPDRDALRKKFGFEGKLVVSTIGFLTDWKRTPEVLRALAPLLAAPDVIRVHAPHPFSAGSGSHGEEKKIRQVLANHRGRIEFSMDFLPENKLLDLVHASDLGFVFHGIHTGSVSAATKQFVAARTPVVVTDSTHAADIHGGVHRVPGFHIEHFCKEVASVLHDAGARSSMAAEMGKEYARINMAAVATQYVDELGRLS